MCSLESQYNPPQISQGLWYTLYMADKVPVQDKLSKILAELMWCLAGTEEDDEYAGQVYLQMEEGDMEEDGVDGDDDDDDDMVILDVKKVDGDVENHEMSIDGVEPEESDSEDAI